MVVLARAAPERPHVVTSRVLALLGELVIREVILAILGRHAPSGRWLVAINASDVDPSETGDETVWGVVAIDRLTGVQTLLYDGGPAADGASLACTPEAAIGTRNGRLLLIEPSSGDQCQGNMFALDLTTGAFSRL